ncbi:hypothetical protein MLD38_040819 [Melastoma candidum]|nr:hypothetical protein MLD38_040819 [Melastoma candidum]
MCKGSTFIPSKPAPTHRATFRHETELKCSCFSKHRLMGTLRLRPSPPSQHIILNPFISQFSNYSNKHLQPSPCITWDTIPPHSGGSAIPFQHQQSHSPFTQHE